MSAFALRVVYLREIFSDNFLLLPKIVVGCNLSPRLSPHDPLLRYNVAVPASTNVACAPPSPRISQQ